MTTEPSRAVFKEKMRDYDLRLPHSKLSYNARLFHVVALRYDLVTRFLSFAQDQRWKRELLRALPSDSALSALDIACGTGDLSLGLTRRYSAGTVTGVDLDARMLRRARVRLLHHGSTNARLLQADMSKLPLPDSQFNVLTGGYALRNAPDLTATLSELHRVLAPGAHAAVLEFRKSPRRRIASLQLRLLSMWGRLWGQVLHGNPEVYGYIAESLSHFPSQEELEHRLRGAGFTHVYSRRLMVGLLAITRFRKPRR